MMVSFYSVHNEWKAICVETIETCLYVFMAGCVFRYFSCNNWAWEWHSNYWIKVGNKHALLIDPDFITLKFEMFNLFTACWQRIMLWIHWKKEIKINWFKRGNWKEWKVNRNICLPRTESRMCSPLTILLRYDQRSNTIIYPQACGMSWHFLYNAHMTTSCWNTAFHTLQCLTQTQGFG